MRSSSVKRGRYPRTLFALTGDATRRAGSPALLPTISRGTFRPLTRETASMTSRTEWPVPVPRLKLSERRPAPQPLERRKMRGGEILDVNEVADAGPVGRVVVGAIYLERGPLPSRRMDGQWNQVRLRSMIFPEVAALVRSRGIEVAEVHVADPMSRLEVDERALESELGAPVGVDGALRVSLGDGDLGGSSVRGAGGREKDGPNVLPRHRREQMNAAGDIGAVVLARIADRLSHVRFRSEVKDRLERLAREDLVERRADGGLGEVGPNELGSPERALVPFAQIVEHHDLLPALEECAHGVRADVAGASSDEKRPHSSAPADAEVGEAELLQRSGVVDVPSVEDHRPAKEPLDPLEIGLAKLVPLGDQHQSVGAVAGFIALAADT